MRDCSKLLFVALGITYSSVAWGQTVPAGAEAGRVSERFTQTVAPSVDARSVQGLESTIPPAEAAAITLKLNSVVVSGSSVYPNAALQETYSSLLGKTVTLAQVFDVAAAITTKYGEDGYILSRAIIPPQALNQAGATIQIQVIEGHVDDVRWPAETRVSREFLAQYEERITRSRPLNVKTLERYMLLANDIPGSQFGSNLVASETVPGASDLVVTVEEDPFSGFVSVDNHGVEASGPYQFSIGGTLNNVLGLNERITAEATIAGPSVSNTPELYYLSFGYDQVLSAEGLTFFANGNLSRGYPGTAALAALDYETRGFNLSTGFSYPFIRTRDQSLTGTVAFDFRNSESFNLGVAATEDRLRIFRAELAYENADSFNGQNQATLAVSKGIEGLGSTLNGNPLASRTPGVVDFAKVTLDLARTQQLESGFSLYGHAFAQWTPNPLLSSQECGYGGRTFGGGFDSSIITGDTCFMASLELRKDLSVPEALADWIDYAQPYGFVDYGSIWNVTPPLGTPAQDSGASAGLGIRFGNDMFSTELAATRVIMTPTSQPGVTATRAWLKTTLRF